MCNNNNYYYQGVAKNDSPPNMWLPSNTCKFLPKVVYASLAEFSQISDKNSTSG